MQPMKANNKNGYLLTVPQAMERYNLGRVTVMSIAKNNGALLHFGKSVRVHTQKFEKALNLYEA